MVDKEKMTRHIIALAIGEPELEGKAGISLHTLYPNLVAEVVAIGYHPNTFAQFARITPHMFYAVLKAEEPLSISEAFRIYDALPDCKSPEYLYSPTLEVIDPSTADGDETYQLESMLHTISVFCGTPQQFEDSLMRSELLGANDVLNDLRHGRPVTYAAWHYALFSASTAFKIEHKILRTCSIKEKQ